MHGCGEFIDFYLQMDVHTLRVYMYGNPCNNVDRCVPWSLWTWPHRWLCLFWQ